MRRLRTAREVVKALGGPEKVMLMAEATKQQFWNWESYFEAFPANTHWIMTKHLRKKNASHRRIYGNRSAHGEASARPES